MNAGKAMELASISKVARMLCCGMTMESRFGFGLTLKSLGTSVELDLYLANGDHLQLLGTLLHVIPMISLIHNSSSCEWQPPLAILFVDWTETLQ